MHFVSPQFPAHKFGKANFLPFRREVVLHIADGIFESLMCRLELGVGAAAEGI